MKFYEILAFSQIRFFLSQILNIFANGSNGERQREPCLFTNMTQTYKQEQTTLSSILS